MPREAGITASDLATVATASGTVAQSGADPFVPAAQSMRDFVERLVAALRSALSASQQ